MTDTQPAIFLDRDGTIIEDVAYLRDCSQVRLLPGAAEAIRLLREAGFRVVVVTNQSGVARGMFSERDVEAVHAHLKLLLAEQGATIDGVYFCPYHPEGVVEAYRQDSPWRKPRCGMLTAAAKDLALDLAASWMIGDSPRDVQAGRDAGCRTVLLTAVGAANGQQVEADFIAADLWQAGQRILEICSGSSENLRVHDHGQ